MTTETKAIVGPFAFYINAVYTGQTQTRKLIAVQKSSVTYEVGSKTRICTKKVWIAWYMKDAPTIPSQPKWVEYTGHWE